MEWQDVEVVKGKEENERRQDEKRRSTRHQMPGGSTGVTIRQRAIMGLGKMADSRLLAEQWGHPDSRITVHKDARLIQR